MTMLSARVSAAIAIAFYVLFIIFLVQVLKSATIFDKSPICGGQLPWGWKVFAILLIAVAILGLIGALITLIVG